MIEESNSLRTQTFLTDFEESLHDRCVFLIIVLSGVNYDKAGVVGFRDGGWAMVFGSRVGRSGGPPFFSHEACGAAAGLSI